MFDPAVTMAVTLALCASAALTRAADYPSAVLEDKPVGYWRLGEADGPTVKNLGSLGTAGDGPRSDTPVTFGLPGAIKGDTNRRRVARRRQRQD